MEDTEVKDGRVETKDLRLATWLYLNSAPLATITPVEPSRCAYTFTLNNNKDKVRLFFNKTLIDEMEYFNSKDGMSKALTST